MYRFSYDDGFCGFFRTYQCDGLCRGREWVVRIQTSGDFWVAKFTSDVFLICNEHCEAISAVLLAYRAATHDGGFAKV